MPDEVYVAVGLDQSEGKTIASNPPLDVAAQLKSVPSEVKTVPAPPLVSTAVAALALP